MSQRRANKQNVDLDSLSYELNLYEKGDYQTLNRILTPSQSGVTNTLATNTLATNTLATNTLATNTVDEQGSEEVSIIASYDLSQLAKTKIGPETILNQKDIPDEPELEQPVYPPLTPEKRQEISLNTKKWIKIDTTLLKLKEIERELKKEKRNVDKHLLEDIETYGLKDITKGSHQLIPKLKKGRKKTFTKRVIHDKVRDFLNTMDVTDDVDELVIQLTDYLDNTRDKGQDTFELKHVRVNQRS